MRNKYEKTVALYENEKLRYSYENDDENENFATKWRLIDSYAVRKR